MLVEKLKNDMIEAMRLHQKLRLTVIRMVKAALDKERIDNKKEINDDLVIEVVGKQIKLRKDSIEEFKKANRQDLVDQTEEELEILKAYLPKQLTDEEVEQIIDETIKKIGASSMKDMGKVMKEITPQVRGKYDLGILSNLIKQKLSWFMSTFFLYKLF